MDTKKLEAWADKSGQSVADLEAKYKDIFATLPSSVPEAQKDKRTLQLLKSEIQSNLRSPAIAFRAIIVGADEPRDMMQAIKAKVVEEYQSDPQGVLDSKKARLDTETNELILTDSRKEINGNPNKRYGQDQPATLFVRRVVMAVRKAGDDKWVPGKIQLRGDIAKTDLPYFQEVEFRALGETGEDFYDLRSSSVTAFRPLESDENIPEIISTAFADKFKPLGEIDIKYHESNRGDYEAFVVTEGTVDVLRRIESEKASSDLLVLNDETLSLDADSVTCWVPKTLRGHTNFGKGSVVTVFARTQLAKKYDREAKQQTDEDMIALNALGVFPVPGLATPADEELLS